MTTGAENFDIFSGFLHPYVWKEQLEKDLRVVHGENNQKQQGDFKNAKVKNRNFQDA